MRDIRGMLEAIGEMASNYEGIYLDAYKREKPLYNLNKRLSLLLASKYDDNVALAIIDRWAELEYKEQTKLELSTRMQAITEWQDETTAINNVLEKLGYSQGYLRKEALEIGFRIEGETGEHFLPSVLVNDPQAVDPQQLSEHTGTHAALVAMGSNGSNASAIAQVYGKDISPTDVNTILIQSGLQVRIAKGKYRPTEKGRMLCNQSTLAGGKMKGTAVIKEWLYNSNKSLRDTISQGVETIRKSRIQ